MKRLLLLFLLLLPVAARCEADDILLPALLRESNALETLCESCGGCVRADTAWVTQSGYAIQSVSRYAYMTNGALHLAEETDAGVRILGGGMGFCTSMDSDRPTVLYYPDPESYSRAENQLRDSFFGISDRETVLSVSNEWDTLQVVTERDDPLGSVRRTYDLENDTLRIVAIREECVRKDGAISYIRETTFVPDARFAPPEALRALDGSETDTARLVTKEDGRCTSLTDIVYPRGAGLRIAAPEGYGVYIDPEGTIPASETDCAVYYLVKNTSR